jgi:hypothetical protein
MDGRDAFVEFGSKCTGIGGARASDFWVIGGNRLDAETCAFTVHIAGILLP